LAKKSLKLNKGEQNKSF